MPKFAGFFSRMLLVLAMGALVAACASTGEARVPEPGSKKWYVARLAEIEHSKAEGKLTDHEYLTLKNEADDTRQEYISASRHNSGTYVGVGFGSYHHHGGHHHRPSPGPRPGGPGFKP